MKKAYILIYDNVAGSREEIKAALDKMPSITHWRYDIPNCFYLVSQSSAQELYETFVGINGGKGRFMFMEASSNSQGLMLEETWYFLSNKAYMPKPPST